MDTPQPAAASRTPSRRRQPAETGPSTWEALPDETLLGMRVRDLGLRLESSPLQPYIDRLYGELDARGITFRPPCYLADEWFCPDKVPVIGIPFCLAHPRLMQIEQRMMLEVEGGSEAARMQLLRHECGHAINYAYSLYKRTRWRELFGRFSDVYSSAYFFRPYSRHYVLHLDDYYAQAHPDEDFAETFAVWLTPESQWQVKYAKWPVMRKLRYTDALMKRIGPQSPAVAARDMPYSAARMTSTLAAYYDRKRRDRGDDFPGYYDDGLRALFAQEPRPDVVRAGVLVRRYRRRIASGLTHWTMYRKYDIDMLISRLARRCDALGLYVRKSEIETLIEFTALVAAIISKAGRFDEGPAQP